MSDQYVHVPRELLERAVKAGGAGVNAIDLCDAWRAVADLKDILAAAPPEDVRAVVEEPAACYVASDDLEAIRNGSKMWATAWASDSAMNPSRSFSEPLYRHPQRQMVLPERHGYPTNPYMCGWNACLDRIAELNK